VRRFTRGCYEAPAIFESPAVSAEIVSLHPGLKVFPCCSHRSFELITRARFLAEGEEGRRRRRRRRRKGRQRWKRRTWP